jgi:probable DNA metabolism protein
MMKYVYLCDNSIDGIFTAIYQAWASRYGHANIKIEAKCEDSKYSNIELFAEYIMVNTDPSLSEKVSNSIKKKISREAFEMVCRVALSDFEGKADLIYRFLILGFASGNSIMEHISQVVVNQMLRINKNVSNEVHHLLGFIRFSEQENGLLISVIHPKNNVLTLVTPHFADRLPNEKFMIYDDNRKVAAFHIPGNSWVIAQVPELNQKILEEIPEYEDEYRALWKTFFDHIAIKERINPKLQRNNLPLRFRGDITEFRNSNTV